MRPGMVLRVARKEVVSTLRDRRAMVSNLLIPLVLLPTLMIGLPLAIGGLFYREQAILTRIAVSGLTELPPELARLLEAQSAALEPSDDPAAAVRLDEAPAGMSVPEGFRERLAAGEHTEIEVFSKRGNLRSEVAAGKIESAVSSYRQELVADRLREAGLDPSVLEPVTIATVDASTEAERSSGQLAWLIPFFIAIWTLTGGQMAAIDATAGEKERGTLEALLVTPIRRLEVVLGKFLATLLFGLSAAMMAITGYVLGGAAIRRAVLPRLGSEAEAVTAVIGGSLHIDLASVVLLLVSSLLLAGVISALLLGITLFARSFKEAQSYVAPLSFLLIVPAIGLQFKDFLDVGPGVYLVPVLNALLLMDDIVRGSVQGSAVWLTWTSLAVAIALLLAFALRNFQREDVIFRS